MPAEFFRTMEIRLPSRLAIRFDACTDSGKHRDHNEDCYGIDAQHALAVVADGMGGFARGEVASRQVVDTVLKHANEGLAPHLALQRAHAEIVQLSAGGKAERMGSTAVVASLADGVVRLDWVGDSRAYLWRNDELRQLTRDHSFVQELIDLGAITPQDALDHPDRNVVTRAIGIRDLAEVQVDSVHQELRPGDRIILCSDGLYGYLGEPRIVETLRAAGADDDVARLLVTRTLDETDAGDNVTVVSLTLSAG
jgi:protein phosphatase